MDKKVVTSRIDPDGVLRINVPIADANAAEEVRVTIEPVVSSNFKPMSQEEWRAFLKRMAGSIDDPTFVRPEQLELETRESFPRNIFSTRTHVCSFYEINLPRQCWQNFRMLSVEM